MQQNKHYLLGVCLTICGLLAACGKEATFEGYKNLPNKTWRIDSTVVFAFNIAEHRKLYDLYYNVRNTISYPYYNLYTQVELVDASGKVLWNKLLDTNLLDAKTGKPYGTGIGDMYDHEILLLKQYQFATQGLYTLKFKHQMRNDTLPDVMAVGVKVLESNQ